MKKVIRVLAIALCVSALSFGAVIDDFSTVQALVSDSTLGPPGNYTTVAIGGGVNRTIGSLLQLGTGSASAEVTGSVFNGSMSNTADGQTSSFYAGLWNLSGPYTSGFTLDVISVEFYTGGALTFSMSDGTNTATYNMAVPAPGPIFAPFAGFTGGVVNLAAVTELGLTFDNTLAQDITLDNFGTNVIPEPGTYAMMAAGLLGLFAIRRKRA